MDFRRILVNESIISAETIRDEFLITIVRVAPEDPSIAIEQAEVSLDRQELFEVAFSLLCLVQEPDDIDVLDCLMDTNLETKEQRKVVRSVLSKMVQTLDELED